MKRAVAYVMGDPSLVRCLGRHGIPVVLATDADYAPAPPPQGP